MASPLPPPRLVATAHDAAGTSIIASDAPLQTFSPFGPKGSAFAVIHSAPSVPVSNTDLQAPQQNTLPRVPPQGVIFTTADIPPHGGESPIHRTQSMDYSVVLAGEITMILDSGEERVIKAGELILQRGTMHRWRNNSNEWCRILFVMVGSEKIVLEDGRVLEETNMPPRA
ncbi:hypothetical protein L228DRAFT_236940 [Xylona heveae TC161]|uniref:Cupin type-2 domain-containing protein n=1 Tax=Xylona heveae (strain CBS 132557 / TC161) TaxID=1328760 RepID=A0A165HV18_XYLHT|nr:hypothetical protein L228DRAFT_236940 [Xylona heveae TC161]KZF23960.1 hypothetical protein L228DRAFT_236940 [Xylona heveae TC161]